MPARTNEYQKLVMMINRSLALPGVSVTESAMLYDSEAQSDREIDILIQAKVSGYEVIVGIECTTVAKPVEVRTLESFKEKHRKVGINKTIVVAKSGFTKSSKDYARKNHIQLLTFDSAGRMKWSKIFESFREMSVYGRSYKVIDISLLMDSETTDPLFLLDNDVQVRTDSGCVSIVEFCGELWSKSDVPKSHFRSLRENEISGQGMPWVRVGFNLGQTLVFMDKNGIQVRPDEITFVMEYTSNYRKLNAREVEYAGEAYVVGAFEDKAKKQFAHFAIRPEGGMFRGDFEASCNLIPVFSKPTD